jgi:acetylornithine/succinyldiaminopimelate/putrescine aminotransferase
MEELANTVKETEDRYQLKTYAKLPLVLDRGRGCYVYDQDGNEYLDLYGGHAVVSTGHCHPRVVEALRTQAEEILFYSNVVYSSVRARAVKKLMEFAGPPYWQAFLANSGSEANENAIKVARALTGRTDVLSLSNSFHGRTYGSLSSTGVSHYAEYLNTPVPGHRILDLQEVADAVDSDTAAVLLEPIQSMGGVEEVPEQTLHQIHDACRSHGAFLIFDEVQTGVGRTGSFLYAGTGGIYPEMVTLAKGIASGVPASALLVTREVAEKVRSGDLGATFGGAPVSCAAMEATLQVLEEEDLIRNAARIGSYLRQELETLPWVAEVRGRGLLLGIKIQGGTAKDLGRFLRASRILTGTSSDPSVLRLLPPLVLGRKEADAFLEVIRNYEPGH